MVSLCILARLLHSLGRATLSLGGSFADVMVQSLIFLFYSSKYVLDFFHMRNLCKLLDFGEVSDF